MRKTFLFTLIAAAGFALALCPPAHAEAVVGQPAPALVVTRLDGKSFDLAAQKGKVVIVNFWATWCAPCRGEMPALDAIYHRDRAKGLVMIGVSADRARHRDDVVEAMKTFSYPAAILERAKSNDFGWPSELPVTYVIGADGIVRGRLTPDQMPVTEPNLDKLLEPLLSPQRAVDKSP